MAAKKITPKRPSGSGTKRTERDTATLGKIEKLARGALAQATRGDNPGVDIRTRTLANVSFNQKRKII
jgi:DNA topoisomerase VI subunit A